MYGIFCQLCIYTLCEFHKSRLYCFCAIPLPILTEPFLLSWSRVRTDGRTVRYERQSRRVDGRFDAWLGVSWQAAPLRTGLDLERLYDRPSGYAT